jgi:acyl-CoA synthetase (AMP-forming)/AMP-acid ligase II
MNFGCAENVGGATFTRLNESYRVEHVDRAAFHERRMAVPRTTSAGGSETIPIVGCGAPHPDMSIRILSPRGRPLPDGRVGRVALRTPSRLACYLKDRAATRRAFQGPYVITGDLGYVRDGEFFWVGRERERITLRGKKYDPSDFERALLEIDGLRRGCFAAFGVADPEEGTEKLAIVAEVRDGGDHRCQTIADQIRRRVFQTLDVTVGEVLLVRQGALSKTSSGKRRHRRFAELYRAGELDRYAIQP